MFLCMHGIFFASSHSVYFQYCHSVISPVMNRRGLAWAIFAGYSVVQPWVAPVQCCTHIRCARTAHIAGRRHVHHSNVFFASGRSIFSIWKFQNGNNKLKKKTLKIMMKFKIINAQYCFNYCKRNPSRWPFLHGMRMMKKRQQPSCIFRVSVQRTPFYAIFLNWVNWNFEYDKTATRSTKSFIDRDNNFANARKIVYLQRSGLEWRTAPLARIVYLARAHNAKKSVATIRE